MILSTIPDIATTFWGSAAQVDAIRAAGNQVAANLANGGSGVLAGVTAVASGPLDTALNQQDNTHPLMPGSVTLSNHWARSTLGLIGATTDGDLGPFLAATATRTSGTRTIVIPVTEVAGTALVGAGPSGFNLANQFYVHNSGDPTRPYPIASVALSSTAITLTMACQIADGQSVSPRYRYGIDSQGTASAPSEAMIATGIYDNDTSDGIAAAGTVLGRILRARTGEIVAASPGGSTAFVQAPMALSSPTYDASPKFGSGALSGGFAYLPNGVLPVQGSVTVEGWVKQTSSSGTQVAIGGGYLWAGVNSSGNLIYGANSVVTTTTTSIATGAWIHVALVYSQSANTVTAWVAGNLVSTLSVNVLFPQNTTSLCVRGLTYQGGFGYSGSVDEVAVFNTARYTAAFTPPTAAYVGNEAGLLCVYHFDGTGN